MTTVTKNSLSSASSKSNTPSMLLKFKRKDSSLGVQKATVKQMANLWVLAPIEN